MSGDPTEYEKSDGDGGGQRRDISYTWSRCPKTIEATMESDDNKQPNSKREVFKVLRSCQM